MFLPPAATMSRYILLQLNIPKRRYGEIRATAEASAKFRFFS